jgi:protein-S-isoprenylcysteine O-methyltransferase Ste14
MSIDPVMNHFGNWWAGLVWFIIFIIFLGFLPFYQKSQRKPASVYGAFVLALALEMFGVPLSMYVIGWIFGKTLPDGVLWGHTLVQLIGLKGMCLAIPMYLTGAVLIFLGWRRIYRQYWSKEEGNGQLVTSGIYNFIRHPQYTGFLLITFGMMCEWVTLPMLIMWPVLVWLYYRLAKKEETQMELEFGLAYHAYRNSTGMFLPRLFRKNKMELNHAGRTIAD